MSGAEDATTTDATADTDEAGEHATTDRSGATTSESADGVDLKGIFKQLTAPMIESLDTRLRDQVEAHVDEQLDAKLAAAIAARLSTVDRAIADLSRTVGELERRLSELERAESPID